MGLLDIYNEHGKHIGMAERNEVHAKGLWHKTIHCWVVTNRDTIIFQQRSKKIKDNPGKLYTTASGHLDAGESMEQAFDREVEEELGINIKIKNAKLLFSEIFKADLIKTDGTEYHDRVFVNRFVAKIDLPLENYNFQTDEVEALFEIKLVDLIDLCDGKINEINADVLDSNKTISTEIVKRDSFLVPKEHAFENVVGRIARTCFSYLKTVSKKEGNLF